MQLAVGPAQLAVGPAVRPAMRPAVGSANDPNLWTKSPADGPPVGPSRRQGRREVTVSPEVTIGATQTRSHWQGPREPLRAVGPRLGVGRRRGGRGVTVRDAAPQEQSRCRQTASSTRRPKQRGPSPAKGTRGTAPVRGRRSCCPAAVFNRQLETALTLKAAGPFSVVERLLRLFDELL